MTKAKAPGGRLCNSASGDAVTELRMYCMCVRGEGVGTRAAPSLPSLCVLMEITHSSDHLYHSRLTPTAEGPRGDVAWQA